MPWDQVCEITEAAEAYARKKGGIYYNIEPTKMTLISQSLL